MKRLILVLAMSLALPAQAGERHDHDDARRAVLAGEILPLSAILAKVAAEFPGELIETELEGHHGRPVYEIKLLTPQGKVMKLLYDARDGTRLPGKGGR